MKNGKLVALAIVVVMVGLAFSAVTPVSGYPLAEHTRFGSYSGITQSVGLDVTAWIDGVEYSITPSTTHSGGTYNVHAFGDESDTAMASRIDNFKTGGRPGDMVYYTIDGNYANEYSTFAEGNYESGNLDVGSAQPAGLLISAIVPAPSSGNDYLFIYSSAGGIDLSNYYITKNDGLLTNVAEDIALSGTSIAGHKYFDLGSDYLNTAYDEVKLVWGATGSVAGGNDIVIDRVEWGNQNLQGGYTSLYDDTRMLDATAPTTGESIHRKPDTSYNTDTNDCSADFMVNATPPARADIGGSGGTPGFPRNIVAVRNGDDVRITWDVPLVDPGFVIGYKIYRDSDNNITNGFSWTEIVDTGGTGTQWDLAGHYADSNNYFYRVRAYGSGLNSNFDNTAVKWCIDIDSNDWAWNWVSIPYITSFISTLDIVAIWDEAYISEISIWSPALDGFQTMFWFTSQSRWADDFVIPIGAALKIVAVQDFTLKVVGANDPDVEIAIDANDWAWNWISLPFDMDYTEPLHITTEWDETYIAEISTWSPALDGFETLFWFPSQSRFASNYILAPGQGVKIVAVQDFTFPPTEAV